MLEGCVPWPPHLAREYLAQGVWEGISVMELVERTARRHPRKTAVVHGETRLNYEALVERVQSLATGLLQLGLAPRDRVVLQLPNGPEFVVTYLALNAIGLIPVTALAAHRTAEVRHFLGASGATAYFIADRVGNFDFRPMAAEMAAHCASLQHVIVAGEPLPGQLAWNALAAPRDAAALQARRPAADEVSTMLLSGGTTSMSKLIPRTHNDYVLNARLCSQVGGFDEDTVFMAILPLGHNYNLASPGMLGTFYRGGTLVIARSTELQEVFTTIERERVTVVAAVVPLVTNWLHQQVAQRFDLSSLKVIQNGGARLAPELRARVRRELRCTPQEIYGTAEGLINMTRLDDPDSLLLESSGAPVGELDEIRVIDESGGDVPDGAPGELVTRGPYTIRGYYNAPETNASAFTAEGFYRMGDIVRKRGRYVVTEGRRKDLINRGGEKISCEEVENLIFGLAQVKQVSLVAMPDPVFGEKGCACVVLQPGAELTFEELVAHLKRQGIATFKLPERLEVMASFPVSPVGKILKRELRELVVQRMAAAGHRQEAP